MKRVHGLLLTAGISIGCLLFFYGPAIFHPNSYFFAIDVDGLNNYYSYAYHIKHDPHYGHFDGMKYPYGEYLHYVDCHPLVANIYKFFSRSIVDISDYSIGFLNLLMIFSITGCSIFLYLILQQFGLSVYSSMAGATGISLLSSQVLLWPFGHYALSYAIFFPLGWYLLLRFIKSKQPYRWSLAIGLHTLCWFYVHTYLGFILAGFTFWVLVFGWFYPDKKAFKKIGSYTHLLIQVFVPLTIVYVSQMLFDTHEGRFEWPFVTAFRASGWSILYPNHSWLKPLYDAVLSIFGFAPPTDQPWMLVGTYIGLAAILTVLFWFGRLLLLLARKQSLKNHLHPEFFPYLFAALLLLVFALGVPFKTLFGGLIDHIPVLKQFIGLGRFAWAFYYVITVFSLIILARSFVPKAAHLLITLAVGLMIVEGAAAHYSISQSITQFSNFFKDDRSGKGLFQENFPTVGPDQYQAILPLPFFYKWHTPFDYGGTPRSEQLSIRLSYFTGLPMIGTFLARPSLTEGEAILQLFNPFYKDISIKDHLSGQKPFLVLWSKEELNSLEQLVWQQSTPLTDLGNYTLASVHPGTLLDNHPTGLMDEFRRAEQTLPFDSISGFYYPERSFKGYYNGFERKAAPFAYRGKGAYRAKKTEHQVVYQSKPGAFDPGQDYIISFWFYNAGNQFSYCQMWLDEVDPANQTVASFEFQPFVSILYDRHWALNEFFFQVNNPQNIIRLRSKGDPLLSEEIYIDELLIRPADVDLYKVMDDGGQLWYIKNNMNVWGERNFE